MSAEDLVARLEADLASVKALLRGPGPEPDVDSAPIAAKSPEPDTSQMPGGVDSAPVAAEPGLDTFLDEGLDIIHELKSGAGIDEVANKLLGTSGLQSIVKAIADLAGKVF